MEKRTPTQFEVVVASQLALAGILAVSLLNFSFEQKKRIRERQHYTCAVDNCQVKDSSLPVHHKVPKSLGGADVIENGVALCNDHHQIYDNLALGRKMIYPNIPFNEAPKTLFKNKV